ncbi:alpha/beta hydrolase [Agromyces bracchium]|uniref:Alpha/beta hydrolase n=1 Tax=Agromyces bracchium TaxID=88376 RepID=A0A6I3MB15_9MICO|nr:alpha/beta hydrolase [Agromyces bracchium]MTH70191.1 alpha/beta hydrolase [Agromyces bracchium]
MRRAGAIGLGVLGAVAIAVVVFLVWAHTVYAGEREPSLDAWRSPDLAISSTDDGFLIEPAGGGADLGLVFIPGARVEPSAYLYKLSGIVEETGITIVVTHPTLNLAFFDTRPLEAFTAEAPDVSRWLVGGHSLGGVRSCQLAEAAVNGETTDVVGMVLFGSYCASDLSGTDLEVLSLVGEFDGLSTPEKVASAAHLLPADASTALIEGANHAAFGDYGPQAGDGVATADRETVRDEISSAVADFLGRST